MALGKKSFVLYTDLLSTVEKMPEDKAGQLFVTILRYVNDLNPTPDDVLVQVAFEPVKMQLKRDLKNWKQKKKKNQKAGKIGGIKSGESRRTKQPLHFASKNEANEGVTVNVNVTDTVIKNNKKDLDEIEIGKTVEFCAITLSRKYTQDQVLGLWKAFIIQNGKEAYHKESDRVKHFRNWIKTQPYEQKKPENQIPSGPPLEKIK